MDDKIKTMNTGMIIAVEGGVRSGKTFLVHRLAERLGAYVHAELDEAFPERIIEDMKQNIRPFERIVWFRNQIVEQFLDAIQRRANGETVITDGFWVSNLPFLDTLFDDKDQFEKELCETLSELDRALLPWPDKVLFLDVSDDLTRKFVIDGGRDFDSSDRYFNEQILPVKRAMEAFYSRPENQQNLVRINREDLDFDKEEDVETVMRLMHL